MDSRWVHLAALIAMAAVIAGCAPAGPATPVSHAPVADTKPEVVPAPATAPDKQPATQTQPEAPVVTPTFLQEVLDSRWKLSALKHLPPRERPVGEEKSWEWIYEGGALRLYPDNQDSLLILVVDHSKPAYQDFRNLVSTPSFVVAHDGNYTSVLRIAAVSQATRAELAAKEWTADELRARFGEPTSRVHNHGIGTYTVTYVPQGLQFEEDKTLKLDKVSAEEIWRQEADSRVSWPGYVNRILEKGKPSPDGKFQAGYFQGAGYWSQSILVRALGKSEVEYHADYFIQDYFWLDNHRLVYGEVQLSQNYSFHIVDVAAEKMLEPINVNGEVKEFGPAVSGGIWYTDKDGVRHEVKVP